METKSIKILSIDDNPDNLISLNALIKEAFPGVKALTALNGEKGLALAAAEDPDLILLDIVMPGMDGFEVCRKLKADKAMSDIPVVFITALKGDKESRIHALECGAEAFLAKPIDETELTAQIRAMVKIKTAKIEKRNEKDRLAALVAERTHDLEVELAERKKAENALRESEERFRSVSQSANDAIVTINALGAVCGWNKGAEIIFGYTEDEMTGKDLTIIMPQVIAAEHGNHVNRVVQGGIPKAIGKTAEKTGIHKNGTVFPIELSLSQWISSSGMFFTGIIRDISERKKAEAIIIESEQKYRALLMNLDAGVVVHAPDTSVILSNPRASVLLGLSTEQMQGKQAFDPEWNFVYENLDPLPFDQYPVNQVKNTKKPLRDFVGGIKHPVSGKITWLITNGFPLLDESGELTEIIMSFVDITKQKQASAALRESEQKYRDIFNSVQDVFYQTDIEGTIIDISPSVYNFLGFERDELCGKAVYDLYLEKSGRDGLLNEIRRIGGLRDYEIRLKSKTGETKYASVNANLMPDANGETAHINGALRDITARKLAEEALQESETIYRELVDKLPDGVYKSTESGKFVAVNPAMATMLGYANVNELMDVDIKTQLYFAESDREDVKLHEGNTEIGVYRMKKKDGSELWAEDHGWLVFDEEKNTVFHEGILRDVTDRKKAEDALHLEQLFSKSVIDSLPGIFYLYSYPELKLVLFNRQQATLFGYEPHEIEGRHVTEWYMPELQKGALNAIDGVMQNGHGTLESYVLTKDGRSLPYYFTAVAFESQGQRFLMGTGNDITERKKAEEEIVKIGQHYKAIIEKAPDGIVLITAMGELVFASPSAKKMFGYAADEVFEGNPSDFTHPDDQQMVFMELYHLQQDPAYVPTIQYRFVDKNGNWRWVESTFTNLLANASVQAIVINFRDITDRKLIQDELKISEDKYRTMIERSNDLIWTLDAQGNFTFMNETALTTTGLNYGEWIGKPFAPLIMEEDMPMILDVFNQTMSGKSCNYELHFKKEDNTILSISVNTSPIHILGKVEGMVSFGRDITERKLAEKQLKLLGRAIDQSPVTVVITDKEGNIEYANPKFTEVTGYTLEEAKGKNPRILQSGEQTKEFYRELWGTILSGNEWHGEFHNKKKNGESYWESAAISSITDKNGEVAFYLAVKEDITEKKKMISELINAKNRAEESENKFRDILDSVKIHLWAFNGVHYTYCSKNWYDYTGQPTDNSLTLELWMSTVHPDDIEKANSVWNENWASKTEHDNYFRLKRYDGAFRYFYCHAVPIYDKKGYFKHFLGFNIDITEQVEAEKKLQKQNIDYFSLNQEYLKQNEDLIKAKERAEESDRLKSAFLANMSHEIRTPMNGILGFANLLKEPGLSGEQQQEYIKIIEKSGERMLNIIKDIVDISKIEAGLMELDIRESDINEQTNFVYTFFKPEVEGKGMKLLLKNSLSGKAAFVKTDREKLYAVLTNLVKNAIKYSDHGTIEFGYVLKNPAPGDTLAMLQFYVKDTGIGIPADRIHAIFDRFVQADIADKRAFQGAGLGLSISKAFIEMLGGTIEVESEEGKGTTFFFTLPYQMPKEEKLYSAPIATVTAPANQIHGLKIIIAEDDPTSEMLISMALKVYSKELIKAKTGVDAVEKCRANPDVDLIMMDIKMPVLNGYDATRQIRGFNKDVIIIAQTAYALIHEKEVALEAGCNDYISKPISVELLKSLVQKYFGT
jgi:PAS domain S-box-containing protein